MGVRLATPTFAVILRPGHPVTITRGVIPWIGNRVTGPRVK